MFEVLRLATNRREVILGTIITFTITSTISIILRLISKRINRDHLMKDDYLILGAQILLYGMAVSEFLGLKYYTITENVGHHDADSESWRIAVSMKLLVAMQVFYASTLTLIKTSICLFYLRIFTVRRFRMICWAVIIFVVCWGVMVFLIALFLCHPFAYRSRLIMHKESCANESAIFIASCVLDLVTDICVFALPVPMIWNLHAPLTTRAALFSIFGLGILTMIVSILRIAGLMATGLVNNNTTYIASYPMVWSFLEPALGITVACGPLLGPLVKKIRAIGKTHHNSQQSTQSANS